MAEVTAAFMQLLAAQARIAKATGNAEATVALFNAFVEALSLWSDTPRDPDTGLDPEVVMDTLMQLDWLKAAVGAGLDSTTEPLDTTTPIREVLAPLVEAQNGKKEPH